MHIVFFTHPVFSTSNSMPRYASMLAQGMMEKGHSIEYWTAIPIYHKAPVPQSVKKWLGYIDQYIIFPFHAKKRLKSCPLNTLFVFTDHALGPWVPLVADRPHVIHCHDFLAQRSALGEIPENTTSLFGRIYQNFIRKGYSRGNHFISVSNKTKLELCRFLNSAKTSEVVYNGLNKEIKPINKTKALILLQNKTGLDLSKGYILHVGGNQWYKNRIGVIEIYNILQEKYGVALPLLMVGHKPADSILKHYNRSPYNNNIHFLTDFDDEYVQFAYSCASVFVFPSLAEGFGWPIAEAMAMGCPVITTNEAPMTEVAGDAALFIPKMPFETFKFSQWALESAKVISDLLTMSVESREKLIERGLINAKRFDTNKAIHQIENIYLKVLEQS